MRVVVGRIGRAHGIRGEVAVEVRTDEPERRFASGALLRTPTGALTVLRTRWHSGRLLATFEEIPDRTAAEAARGTLLEAEVDPNEQPADDGEYYDRHLVGLEARSHAGDVIGRVTSIVHHGEQDTLVVGNGERDVLIPFVTAIVPTVDVAGGFVVIADMPGLLDPAEAD